MRAVLIWLGILTLMCALPGNAQFRERLGNPTVTVDVEHPPAMGLMVDQLVLGPVRGDCAEELAQILVGDLAANGLAVANRASRHGRAGRYDRNFGERVHPAAAEETGRWYGRAAMVGLDVGRCVVETKSAEDQKKTTVTNQEGRREEVLETTYRLRAEAFLEFSLWTVDLTTGRALGERSFTYESPRERFSSQDGHPEVPSALDLLHGELDEARAQVRRLFLPWTEELGVLFYDDRDCGLRNAYRALRRGDLGQAYAVSEQNLAACGRTPNVERKLLARAHYNVGIVHLLRRDYDAALAALHTAEQMRPSGIMREGIAAARKAKEVAASMADLQRWSPGGRVRPGYAVETLRNADVIRMVREGVPTSDIVSKVNGSANDFDTSTRALIELNGAGIDREIIMAMLTAD